MQASQRWTLVAAILGSSIVFLDGTVVNVALPRIGTDLPSSSLGVLEGQTYVVSGYLATLAALLVLAGALADFHGRRRVFTLGLAGFGITSIACGVAPSMELLVAARILQAAAGAFLVPCALSIITVTFDGGARVRAFGIWTAATSATTTLGPPLGGLLVDTLSWRAAFLINVPLVLAALWLTRRHMAESRNPDASGRFDWLGAVVVAVAIGGLAFGAIRGQQRQWGDPLAWSAIVAGLVALVAFPVLMARRPDPLVPLGLFRIRTFAVINLATLLIYAAVYSILAFQNLFLQGVLGYTPLAAAITGTPFALLLALLSAPVGLASATFGARRFLAIGPALIALGMAWWFRVPATSAAWRATVGDPGSLFPPLAVLVDPLPAVVLMGIGMAFVAAPLTATLMSSIPPGRSGLGSAINNAISRVGQPLLAAGIFIAVTDRFYAALGSAVPGLDTSGEALRRAVQPLNPVTSGVEPAIRAAATVASTDAFHVVALVLAILLLAGAAVSWLGLTEESRGAA